MSAETERTRDVRREAVSRNIESIVNLEQEDERRLSRLHKVSHRIGSFVGTIHFVILQIMLVAVWVAWNAYATVRFDPYPFNLLSAVLALEAVLLTSFVLIRQNTIDERSDRRNHLELQINLLAEKEATSILAKLDAIAERFDIDFPPDAEPSGFATDPPVESIARDLRKSSKKASV